METNLLYKEKVRRLKTLFYLLISTICLICLSTGKSYAAVGDTFTAKIDNDGTPIDCTFKVLTVATSDENGTVQVGNGEDPAINNSTSGSITIPETIGYDGKDYNVISIGVRAFSDCTSLATVSFPKVETIGDDAFLDCISLANVNFSEVKTIGNNAFNSCSSLESVSFSKVTSIGLGAFFGCDSLINVSYPEIKTVGDSTFNSCSSLESVSFPKVASIGMYAFSDCTSLTSVSFPKVTNIGTYAFSNCTSLSSVSFPEVINIDISAFRKCSSLTSVSFPKVMNIKSMVFYGCMSLKIVTEKANKVYGILQEDGSIKKCDSVGNIIEDEEFFNKYNITDLLVSPEVSQIPEELFLSCYMLQSVTLLNDGEEATPLTISKSAFDGCPSLRTVELPNTTDVEKGTFGDCYSLASVSFPEITSIGLWAFSNCSSLTSVNFPKVANIGNYAFEYCTSLKIVTEEANKVYGVLQKDGSVKKCDSAGNIIEDEEFFNKYNITDLLVSHEVSQISEELFSSCYMLQSVTLLSTGEETTQLTIGAMVFNCCTSLKTLDLANTIGVRNEAFGYCYSLASVSFPKVKTIGDNTFLDCTSLATVSFPKVTSIGDYAFYGCMSLKIVTEKANKVYGILQEDKSIKKCDSVGNIIEDEEFFNKYNITDLLVSPEVSQIPQGLFSSCYMLQSVTLLNDGKEATRLTIDANAFNGCPSLRTVNLPNTTSVKNYVFGHCYSLASVNFSEAVNIGNNAFLYSTLLVNITVSCAITNSMVQYSGQADINYWHFVHKYGEDVFHDEDTQGEDSTHTGVCIRIGCRNNNEDFTSPCEFEVTLTSPTETEDGHITSSCTVCEYEYKSEIIYRITENAGGVYKKNTGNDYKIKTSEGADLPKSILIDGKTLLADDYYVSEDGEIIIESEYMNKLTSGVHTIWINYEDGFAQTTVTVSRRKILLGSVAANLKEIARLLRELKERI